jgi:hypothetical protein
VLGLIVRVVLLLGEEREEGEPLEMMMGGRTETAARSGGL